MINPPTQLTRQQAPQSIDQTLPFTKAVEEVEQVQDEEEESKVNNHLSPDKKNVTSQILQEEIISENHFKSITTNSNSQYQFEKAILGSSSADDSKIKGSYCDWRKLYTPQKFAPASSVQQLADVLFKQTKNSFNFQKSQISGAGGGATHTIISSNVAKHRPRISDLSASNIGSWRSRDLCYVEPVNEFMNQEESKNQIQIEGNQDDDEDDDDDERLKRSQVLASQRRIKSALRTGGNVQDEHEQAKIKHNRNISQLSINSQNQMIIDLMSRSQKNQFYNQLEKRYYSSGNNKPKGRLQENIQKSPPRLKKLIPQVKQRSFSVSSSSSSSSSDQQTEEPVKQEKPSQNQLAFHPSSSTTSPIPSTHRYQINNNNNNNMAQYSQQKTFITSSPSSHIKNKHLFSQNTEDNLTVDGDQLTIRSNQRDGQLTIGAPITCDELQATQNSTYLLYRQDKKAKQQQCENAVLKAYQQGIKKASRYQHPNNNSGSRKDLQASSMEGNFMRRQLIQISDLPVQIEQEGEDKQFDEQEQKNPSRNNNLMRISSSKRSLMKRTLQQVPTTSSIVKHIRKASITTNKAEQSKSNLTFALDNQDEQEEQEQKLRNHTPQPRTSIQSIKKRQIQQLATPREKALANIIPTPTHRKQTSHFFRKELATPPSEHRRTVRPLIHHYKNPQHNQEISSNNNLIISQKEMLNRQTVRRGRSQYLTHQKRFLQQQQPIQNSINSQGYDSNVLTTNGNSSINQSAISVLFGAVQNYLSNIKSKHQQVKRKKSSNNNESESVLSSLGNVYYSSNNIQQQQSQFRNPDDRAEILIQNQSNRHFCRRASSALLDSELKNTLQGEEDQKFDYNSLHQNDRELLEEYEQYQTGYQNIEQNQYNSLQQPLHQHNLVGHNNNNHQRKKQRSTKKSINQKKLLQAFEQKAQNNIKVYKQMLKKQIKSKNQLTQRIGAMEKLVEQIQSAVMNKNNISATSQQESSQSRQHHHHPQPIIVPTSISLFPNIPSGNQEELVSLIQKFIQSNSNNSHSSSSSSSSISSNQVLKQLKSCGGIKQYNGAATGAQSSSSTTQRTRNSQHLCSNLSGVGGIQIESSSSSARNVNHNQHMLSGTGSLAESSNNHHQYNNNVNLENQELKRVNDRLAHQLEENLEMFQRLNKALMVTENKAISREKEISIRDKEINDLKKQCQDLMNNIAKIYTLGKQLGICNNNNITSQCKQSTTIQLEVPQRDSPIHHDLTHNMKISRNLSSPATPFEKADNLSSHRNSSSSSSLQQQNPVAHPNKKTKTQQQNNFMMMLSEEDSKASEPLLKQSLSSQSCLLKSSQNISIRESPILKKQNHQVKNVQQAAAIVPQMLKQSSSSSSIINPCSNSSYYMNERKIPEQEKNIRNSKTFQKLLRNSLSLATYSHLQSHQNSEKQNHHDNGIDQSLVINLLNSPQQFENEECKNQQHTNMTQSIGTCSGSVLIAEFMKSILGQQPQHDQGFGRLSSNINNTNNNNGNSIAFSGSFANNRNQSNMSSLRLSQSGAGLSQQFRMTKRLSSNTNNGFGGQQESKMIANSKRESFGGIETSSSNSMKKELRKSLVERMAPSCLRTSDVESVLKSIEFATLVSKHNEKLQQNQFQASKR